MTAPPVPWIIERKWRDVLVDPSAIGGGHFMVAAMAPTDVVLREGRYPTDVHLFANALLKRSVRGGLVDGPVARSIFSNLKGVTITEPDPLAAFQDDRAVFHDDIHDYSTNEPTMDGTASAILMWVTSAQ